MSKPPGLGEKINAFGDFCHRTRYVDFVGEDGCVALSSQCVSKQLLLCQRHSLHYTMILVNIAWSFALKGVVSRFSVPGLVFRSHCFLALLDMS